MKRPLGVSFISYFYIFGAVVLIITAIFFNPDANEFGIADRFGLPNFPEQPFRIILAVVSLIIIYGYMRLKRWGFWLMVLYSFGFGLISYILLFSYNQQLFTRNFIWSVIVLIYTFYVRKSFFHVEKSV
jgi:4-hydroxybenzoate polyprenyltransferase